MSSSHEQLRALGRRRWTVAIALTAVMVTLYFGYMLLVGFAKEWLSHEPVPGLSYGVLLGAIVIVCAWLLTFVYVQWANRVYDRQLHELRGEKR